MVGGIAVFLLSKGSQRQKLSLPTLCIGVGSGLSFAITSLLVREASLELSDLPTLHRAAWGTVECNWLSMCDYAAVPQSI